MRKLVLTKISEEQVWRLFNIVRAVSLPDVRYTYLHAVAKQLVNEISHQCLVDTEEGETI